MIILALALAPVILVAVPLGLGSLDRSSRQAAVSEAPDLRLSRRLAVPAAVLATVALVAPPGPAGAALVLPWIAVGAAGTFAALQRFLADPARLRPGVAHAADAALAFLAVAAIFLAMDRLGAQPFGFSPTIILLTAIHFHVAGFVLIAAGAAAWRVRPSRALELALGSVVLGIPLTALGFFGFAALNWAGSILVVVGGVGIGLGHLAAAGSVPVRSRGFLRTAGVALLASMPLAAIYSTAILAGVAGPSIGFMASTHGLLNVVGFALPAAIGWHLARAGDGARERSSVPQPGPVA